MRSGSGEGAGAELVCVALDRVGGVAARGLPATACGASKVGCGGGGCRNRRACWGSSRHACRTRALMRVR